MKKGKYQKKTPYGRIFYWVALVALSLVLFFSLWYLADYFIDSRKQAGLYDDLALVVDALRPPAPTQSQADDPTGSGNEPSPEMERIPDPPENLLDENGILREYAPIYAQNDHVAGWIRIEGTRIDYPVMQTPDQPNYYLERNFDREWAGWGCLYAREECDLETPSDNVTIYGHNMRDGSMFAGLNGYTSRDFWEDHRFIQFDTLTEHHTYEIFSVFTTTATEGMGFTYHDFINAADEAEFDAFIGKCLALSIYDTGLTPTYGDKIICLSTCTYNQENGRLVVAAVRIR